MSVNRWPCNCSPYGDDVAVGEKDYDALLTEVRFLKGVARGVAADNTALLRERDEAVALLREVRMGVKNSAVEFGYPYTEYVDSIDALLAKIKEGGK